MGNLQEGEHIADEDFNMEDAQVVSGQHTSQYTFHTSRHLNSFSLLAIDGFSVYLIIQNIPLNLNLKYSPSEQCLKR